MTQRESRDDQLCCADVRADARSIARAKQSYCDSFGLNYYSHLPKLKEKGEEVGGDR